MPVELNIHHNSPCWASYSAVNTALKKAVQLTWQCTRQAVNETVPAKHYEASFVLANNEFIQSLNKTYRNKNQPTNVLSFPNAQSDTILNMVQDDIYELGDVIFAFETIIEEADNAKISFEDHVSHMAIHGFLHLLGYDHIEEAEAEKMEQLERQILSQLGLHDPYLI